MKECSVQFQRLVGLSALVSAALLSACAAPAPSAGKPVAVPANLQVGADEKLAFIWPAKGVQIYECRAGTDGKPAWAFVAPEAELFNTDGASVGKHYGGPTWEHKDGSKTVGAVKQRADSPSGADKAIPWLLLSAKSAGGAGVLVSITSIQRVNTVGGVAPAGGCAAGDVGKQARVSYTTDYYYFAKN